MGSQLSQDGVEGEGCGERMQARNMKTQSVSISHAPTVASLHSITD